MSDRIRILHLVGVCDSHTVMLSRLSRDPRNLPMHFEGNVEITSLVDDRFELVGMLCGDLPTESFSASPFAAVLNGICDPDTNAGALRAAASIVDQLGVGVFNDPRRVAELTRDNVADRLAGIEGLLVPATARIAPAAVREVIPLASAGGVEPPFLVREAGRHGGLDLQLIRGEEDRDLLERYAFDGRHFYVTEFVDRPSPDGIYRKYRVIVVGGEPIPKHQIASSGWNVHARDRRSPEATAALQREDDEFVSATSLASEQVFREIHARLGLDYFGVDFGIDQDGRILLFEANSCVRALEGNATESPIPSHRRSTQRIRAALRRRMLEVAGAPEDALPS